MRVTFDSNVWQKIVEPNLARKTSFHHAFLVVHNALLTKRIHSFICGTVGTLEAIRSAGRRAYFTSMKPKVSVNADVRGNEIALGISIGAIHEQHPGLPGVLMERLQSAFALGMRLMRAPRIALPLPASFMNLAIFADEIDVPTSAARDNEWAEMVQLIEQRGVSSGVLRSLTAKAGGRTGTIGEQEFARAVTEWAHGDSVAAHVVYRNDVFCIEDHGKSTDGPSVLDYENRLWLRTTSGTKFATISQLADQIGSITGSNT